MMLPPLVNRRRDHGKALAACSAYLEVARCALDREVSKRLSAERDMAKENQQLRTQSVRDPLTGLYNRHYLEASIAREESRSRRSGEPLGMMMIDIDHFKHCNDTFGHAAGDAVLGAVSHYMKSHARSEDILCRYGKGAFVLFMTNTRQDKLRQRAETLRSGVPQLQIEHEKRPVGPITLSIGLAVFPENGDDLQTVLRAADVALYDAKRAGCNRVVVSDSHAPQKPG